MKNFDFGQKLSVNFLPKKVPDFISAELKHYFYTQLLLTYYYLLSFCWKKTRLVSKKCSWYCTKDRRKSSQTTKKNQNKNEQQKHFWKQQILVNIFDFGQKLFADFLPERVPNYNLAEFKIYFSTQLLFTYYSLLNYCWKNSSFDFPKIAAGVPV
jgi:hypothetical protein